MSKVCAIVVSYRPDAEVRENLAALRRQVEHVIVVDNASSEASRALLESIDPALGLELIFNPDNRGIAAAFNQGMARADGLGYEWVATFDQDSRLPPGFIAGLQAAYERFPEKERVAVVGPIYRDRHLGNVYSPSEPLTADNLHDQAVSVTASSGNLVALRAVRAVGGLREDFFIDCVDFEFCLRCRRRGWLVLEARQVQLEHAQGRWQQRRWLWRRPRINDYGPVRRYYQARNRLVMYRHFAGFDPRWILRDARGFAFDFAKLLMFCADRRVKLRAMGAGIWDGLTGRLGPWRAGGDAGPPGAAPGVPAR